MKRSQNSLSKADTSVRTLAESGILGLVHANSMNAGNITLCDMAKRRKGVLWGESRFGQGLLCQASPVPGLVLLHEHLAEVIAKYQCSLKQESKAKTQNFFIVRIGKIRRG
jgi:hypothetical protein